MMEGRSDLDISSVVKSPDTADNEISNQSIVSDASGTQPDENNVKYSAKVKISENDSTTEQDCIISLDSPKDRDNVSSNEVEVVTVEATTPPQETLPSDLHHATEHNRDLKRKNTTLLPSVKKQRQAQLNFSAGSSSQGPLSLKLKLGPRIITTDKHVSDPISTSERISAKYEKFNDEKTNNFATDGSQGVPSQENLDSSPRFIVKIPLKKSDIKSEKSSLPGEDNHPKVISVPSSFKDSKSKKLTFKLRPNISRTTVIRDKSKSSRTNPGPLVSLNYDLYDDSLISAPMNETAAREALAFGYPVVNSPWLLDVTHIIAFISMFQDIIQIGPLGPADFEKGLALAVETEEDSDTSLVETSSVSPTMDLLFRKLLALVLNRKKPIAHDGQRAALQELKSKYIDFGLPSEWRDDSSIHVTTSIPCDVAEDMVDESRPQLSSEEAVEFEGPLELLNPFHENDFEKFGLGGIKSSGDRCIMMRCMVNWCLSESTSIRQRLLESLNQPDASGERDTFYASRAILKGFTQTIELKKDLQRKPLKQGKQSLPSGTKDNFPGYFDPTSDPLCHPLSFRLNEFVVGDCGFHIGRFYLVRMADAASGRVASLEQMRGTANDPSSVRSSDPSSFALYVEDVHSLLVESLDEFGVEFDKDGNEVESDAHPEESRHWYCVASSSEELKSFVAHLSKRLGFLEQKVDVISPNSMIYKAALHMYQYLSSILPMLSEYEHIRETSVVMSRASRRKRVAYNDQSILDDDAAEYLGGADEDYSEQEEQDDEYLD